MTTTTTTTVTEVLDAMLALYAAPGTWIRDGIAKDAAGRSVPADSPAAAAWSLEGALERVIGDWEGEPHRQRLMCDAFDACGVDLAAFNDTARNQQVVIAVLQYGRDSAARS